MLARIVNNEIWVTIGEMTWHLSVHDRFTTPYSVCKRFIVEPEFYDVTDGTGHKKLFQEFTRRAELTPKAFLKLFKKLSWEVREELEPHLSRYARNTQGFVPGYVKMVIKSIDYLKQAENDGLKNIAPIIFLFNKDPHQLKKMFPPRIWKQICANSYTRNRFIKQKVFKHIGRDVYELLVGVTFMVERLNDVPMTSHLWTIDSFNVIYVFHKNSFRKVYFKNNEMRDLMVEISDTIYMSRKLGETMNLDWSIAKWREKHKEFTYAINKLKYSDEPFAILSERDHPRSFNNFCSITLLESPYEVALQGSTQNHCVASYIHDINFGDYLVYTVDWVEDGKDEKATLGLDLVRFTPQLKGAYNKTITNRRVLEDVEVFVAELIKRNSTQKRLVD